MANIATFTYKCNSQMIVKMFTHQKNGLVIIIIDRRNFLFNLFEKIF